MSFARPGEARQDMQLVLVHPKCEVPAMGEGMPFRNAWIWVLLLLALTFAAFWPGYFSKLPDKKLAHHYHAASAVLWMILAAVQSWTIHHGETALHRRAGLAIFVLFPFFLAAGTWVIHVEATTVLGNPISVEGKQLAQFGFFDPLANIAFAVLFWGGLKYRHNIHLHARYMLGTLLFVISPIGFRLLANLIPFLKPDENFSYAMAGGNIIAFAIAVYLHRLAPKHGQPFLIVAAFIAAQQITFETLGRLPEWGVAFGSLSGVSLPLLLVLTGLAGLGIALHGWTAGARLAGASAAIANGN